MLKQLMLLTALVVLGSCDSWNTRKDQRGYDPYDQSRRYEESRRISEDRDMRDMRDMREKRRKGNMSDMGGGMGDDMRMHRYDDPFIMVATPETAWLTLDYACAGSLRKAQWLVCENERLGLLHRKLAMQWETARRSASPERLNVLAAQQNAFLNERNACEDSYCVGDAYNRYLDGRADRGTRYYRYGDYEPEPTWKRPVIHEIKYVKYKEKPVWHGGYRPRYDKYHDKPGHSFSDYRPRSCVAEIGFASAQGLSERCDAVTPGLSSLCSLHNSCGGIRAQIDRGCGLSNDKPGFCRRY